jgi:hypothetical protein
VGFSEVKVPEKPILQGFRRSVTSAKVHYIPDVSGYAAKLKIRWWQHRGGSSPFYGIFQ